MSESFLESIKSLSSSGIDLSKCTVQTTTCASGRAGMVVVGNSKKYPSVYFIFSQSVAGGSTIFLYVYDSSDNVLATIADSYCYNITGHPGYAVIYSENASSFKYATNNGASGFLKIMSNMTEVTGNWASIKTGNSTASYSVVIRLTPVIVLVITGTVLLICSFYLASFLCIFTRKEVREMSEWFITYTGYNFISLIVFDFLLIRAFLSKARKFERKEKTNERIIS